MVQLLFTCLYLSLSRTLLIGYIHICCVALRFVAQNTNKEYCFCPGNIYHLFLWSFFKALHTEVTSNIRTGSYHVLLMFVKGMHSFEENWRNVSIAWFNAAFSESASNENIASVTDYILSVLASANQEIYIIIYVSIYIHMSLFFLLQQLKFCTWCLK